MAQGDAIYEMKAYSSDGRSYRAFETGDISEHQNSIADNRDANKAVRLKATVCILGANGEYSTLTVTNKSGAANTAQGVCGVDIMLIKNVPDWVQYGLYGQFSPWDTPAPKVRDDDLRGVVTEPHTVTTNAVTIGSSRQTNTTTATLADATAEDRVKLTPLANEIIMYREGGILMHDYDAYTIA